MDEVELGYGVYDAVMAIWSAHSEWTAEQVAHHIVHDSQVYQVMCENALRAVQIVERRNQGKEV